MEKEEKLFRELLNSKKWISIDEAILRHKKKWHLNSRKQG